MHRPPAPTPTALTAGLDEETLRRMPLLQTTVAPTGWSRQNESYRRLKLQELLDFGQQIPRWAQSEIVLHRLQPAAGPRTPLQKVLAEQSARAAARDRLCQPG